MTKARRLRLYGPKSRLERFLTWKKGPLTTERIAIFLIIALCYINAQMILAIYNENNYIEQEENLPHIGKSLIIQVQARFFYQRNSKNLIPKNI